jgi:hypothetical protein
MASGLQAPKALLLSHDAEVVAAEEISAQSVDENTGQAWKIGHPISVRHNAWSAVSWLLTV